MTVQYIPATSSISSVNGQQTGDVEITPQSIGAVGNDTMLETHSLTGWVRSGNGSKLNLSFNETNRLFTMSPISPNTNFFFHSNGIKFIKTGNVSITIPNTTGVYFIYFDENGVLKQSLTPFFRDLSYVFVSIVYWNATQQKAIYLSEEMHGQINRNLHLRLHSQGTIYKTGLVAGNYSLIGDGSSDDHAKISISNGEIMDEDILISITHSATPNGYSHEQVISPVLYSPLVYLINNDFQISEATQFPLKMGTVRPKYNKNTAGVWSLEDVESNDYYIAMWVYATSDVRHPIITMIGQRTDSNLENAKLNNLFENLNFGSQVPFAEFRLLYRLIYKVSSLYTNSIKAKLEDVLDQRNITSIQISAISVSDHNDLNNRTGINTHPSSSIGYDNTDSGLSATDVKEAIDELQSEKPTTEYVDISTRNIFSGTTSVPTITANVNTGVLTVGNINVNAHATSDFTDNIKRYTINATTLQLVKNQYSYIVINNSATPLTPFYQIITDNNLINHSNIISVANVLWEEMGNDLDVHIFKVGDYGNGTANKISHRLIHTDRFAHESGLALTESPARIVNVSSGKIWYDGSEISLSALTSSVANIHLYYHLNGAWTCDNSLTQYDNYRYDNGTDLITLSSEKYSVNWIFRDVSSLNTLSIVLGIGDYNLAQAQGSSMPMNVPDILNKQHILVGRIIVKKNESIATQIDTSFGTIFNTSGISNHNDVLNIQGGQTSEYYHLTNSQHTISTQSATTLRNGYLTSSDWNTFNTKQSKILYGEMFQDSPTGSPLSLTTLGQFYKWSNSSVGLLSGITHNVTDDLLVVPVGGSGVYKITANICGFFDKINQLVTVGIYNGANITNLKTYFKIVNASNQSVNATISGFLTLSDSESISLWMSSSTSGDTFNVYNINVNMIKI